MENWLDPGNNPLHYLEVESILDSRKIEEIGINEYTLEIVNDIPHSLQYILTQLSYWQQILFDYFDCTVEEL